MSSFTSAQQAAIAARGNVLVVAGAGTGKTRTLVERCLRLLREGASLEEMLIVTFTTAAAAEMRVRLRKALEQEAGAGTSQSQFFAEQAALLDTAQISTLHSFCLSLVREHFHELAIDPQVVVLDERQTRPLARECLTELLAGHYAGRWPHSAALQQFIRRHGRGSDESLCALVGRLHNYAQSLPDPDGWLVGQLAVLNEATPTQWHAWLAASLDVWRKDWLAALGDAPDVLALKRCRAALTASAGDLQSPSVVSAADGAATASRRHWVQMSTALTAILAADATEHWQRKKSALRPAFAKLFEEAAFFLSLLGPDGSATALNEDWEWSRHELAALVELTRQFAERFTEAKRQLGGVDFADVEQLSLRLLRDENGAAARRCRERFAHVFVDEYQDINAAQDAILRAVSRSGTEANRFLVGDIKQSIYRFRLANPRIFAGYAEAWGGGSSRRVETPFNAESSQSLLTSALTSVIALADNFRSHATVLNFVNALFRPLMRAGVGGVVYDTAAELRFGNASERVALAAKPMDASRIELHVLTSDEPAASDEADEAEGGVEELLAIEREARFVATRLREWHRAGHPVWDESARGFRPVQWRDMVVLMRSPGTRGEAFAKEFHRAGVPLHADRGGFYESLEVTDLLNLLRLLDNPLQDLPLLAVLRSPLVGMSLEELVAIRKVAERTLMWNALTKFRATGNSTTPASTAAVSDSAFAKAAEFLARFAEWRQLIRLGSLTQCLECVLAETHYEALLLAEPRGPERVANVRRLLDLARQFDPLQRQGLHRFLRFVEAQEEAELDHDPAPLPTEDAVRLMSIHQSKGLEFPVVVVAGLGVRFNLRDLSGDVLLDGELGLCPMVSPPESQRRFPSLPHWLAKQRGRRESLGEELRLLYVALTRTRDTLLLCGTDAGKSVAEKWREPATAISDLAVLKARCPLDWLRLWLSGVAKEGDWLGEAAGGNELLNWRLHAAGEELVECGVAARSTPTDSMNPPQVGRAVLSPPPTTRMPLDLGGAVRTPRPTTAGTTGERTEADAPCPEGGEGDGAMAARLRERLTRPYPHEAATWEQAKTSVSVLRRRAEADEEAFQLFPASKLPRVPRRRSGGLTATQVGLAHHAFLQHVELSATSTKAELMAEAERLQSRGVLTEREAEVLVFEDLFRFWDSEVGRLVRRHAKEAQREVPFTARFTARELGELTLKKAAAESERLLTSSPTGGEDFVIVQGVVDLAVFRAEEIWLLDYKTDHFGEAELSAKLREHGLQLRLYARALKQIYKKPVTRRWLHFLALGRTEEL